MDWPARIAHYAETTGFPPCMTVGPTGEGYGLMIGGNNYSGNGYYGGYPPNYLRRMRALFPEKLRAIHVFAGRVDLTDFPGDTLDSNADLQPTFVADAHTMGDVPLGQYDIALADPPYSVEDATRYGTPMIDRKRVLTALERLPVGAHLVWLDQAMPMYRKDTWAVEAEITFRRSTNHRYRVMIVFRRLADIAAD